VFIERLEDVSFFSLPVVCQVATSGGRNRPSSLRLGISFLFFTFHYFPLAMAVAISSAFLYFLPPFSFFCTYSDTFRARWPTDSQRIAIAIIYA